MKLLKRLAMLTAICLIGVYGFVQSGIFNVAATIKDGPVITWLLTTTMKKSVERRAQNIEVPDINNDEMILAGLSDYVSMCAQCHGEPEKPPGFLTQGLNPPPPNLKHLTEAGTAAEMFWIISNGIRMTGMPAFGKTHKPEEIWPVVSFIQSAKGITSSDYNRMKNEAEHYGHHKSTSNMNEQDNDQRHLDEVKVVHEDHVAATHSAKTSDQQSSENSSLHQEEEGHDHHHDHGDKKIKH